MSIIADEDEIEDVGKGATYGKCRAMYADDEGNVVVEDFGTMAAFPCKAKDAMGYPLFKVG